MRKIHLQMKGLALLLFFVCLTVLGQSQTVTGSVKDADKKTPISGVTVKVVGASATTQTDDKGNFSVKATPGQILLISSIGYESQRITVVAGKAVVVSLKSQSTELEEVTVAMDLKRKPRELGYSVGNVTGQEIQETQRENFVNSLQGRVAGLTVTPTSGQAGASSSIVLRGYNSMSLNNQPLFVVDGIIIDNQTVVQQSDGGTTLGTAGDGNNRNNDYTNRIADINPNDIASVTILKGPEATALYGSQASSGAIVITTKKAKTNGKLGIAYDNSFRFSTVRRLAQLNNDFSLGINGVSAFAAGNTSFNYFGPKYPANQQRFDNIGAFFRTGLAQTHNLSLDFGTKNVGFRLSASYFNQTGVIPNNDLKKINLRFSNTTKIGKYVDITPSITYTNQVNNKPLKGAGSYLMNLYVWPVENDAREYLNSSGTRKLLFGLDPSLEVENPFFNANSNRSQDKTDRLVANIGININPTKWLTVSGRFGYDTYKADGYSFYHPQSNVALPGGLGGTAYTQRGALDNYYRKYTGYNHTITATARKTLGKFSARVMVGNMWQDYETQMFGVAGTKLIDSTSTDSSNTLPGSRIRLSRNYFGLPQLSISRQSAYFGEVAISFNNLVFLSYTRRYETASVFPEQNRNYNYPGVSASVIVSDIFPVLKKGTILNYWKLRASSANTARLPDPYLNQSVFTNNFASSNTAAYSYGFYNNNKDLKPERQNTYELGTELKLFNNTINIEAAYYNTLATEQIVQGFRASYGTGFVLNTQNAGSSRNQGFELTLDIAAIKKKDFLWNVKFNFNRMWSEVLQLPVAIASEYYLADTWVYGNARGGLYRNQQTTTMTSYGYLRNNRGQILINPATGLPVIDPVFRVRGNRNPAFTLGTLNSFRYKNFSLSFLWDLKVGGDIFNGTDMYLTLLGKSARTADRLTPRVIDGILNDGLQNTANPTRNTISVVPQYNFNYYNYGIGLPEEEFIEHDVNWLRLRDLTFTYTLPANAIKSLKGIKSLGLFFTGSDLILLTNYSGADPAVSGTNASSRGVGAFGFDFGSLATPSAYNFGLKATF